MATVDEIAAAIQSSNINLLTSAPGVGKKLAERIVVELRDKIKSSGAIDQGSSSVTSAQAEEALMALGFKQSDAQLMLKGLDPSLSISDQVKAALKGKK